MWKTQGCKYTCNELCSWGRLLGFASAKFRPQTTNNTGATVDRQCSWDDVLGPSKLQTCLTPGCKHNTSDYLMPPTLITNVMWTASKVAVHGGVGGGGNWPPSTPAGMKERERERVRERERCCLRLFSRQQALEPLASRPRTAFLPTPHRRSKLALQAPPIRAEPLKCPLQSTQLCIHWKLLPLQLGLTGNYNLLSLPLSRLTVLQVCIYMKAHQQGVYLHIYTKPH